MFKTCISCLFAIVVVIIVGMLVYKTVKQESARPTGPVEAVLSNGPDSRQPILAFTNTEMLGDYLLSNANHDLATASRIKQIPAAIILEAGTRALVLGISGPGQMRVKISSGKHTGQILYVNYAVVQEPGS